MIDIFIYLFFSSCVFLKLKQDNFLLKGFCLFVIINLIFTILNYYFDVENSFYFVIQSICLYYIFIVKTISNIKGSDYLSKTKVNLIFYKPKTIKQFLLSSIGLTYSSAGIIVYNKSIKKYYIYQMRYESKTLQKIQFDCFRIDRFKNKYLIINTDIELKYLPQDWENDILKQKARQVRTMYLRLNCLWSLKEILKNSKKFKYHYEVLPCIYLLKLKIKRSI